MSRITPERFPAVPKHLVRDFEDARRQLAGTPPRLRYAYVDGRAQGMSHAEAIRWVERLSAVRRRWHRDSKECERCGLTVLWRREGRRPVAIDQSGRAHACPEDL